MGAGGWAPGFLREAWGPQGQAGRESAWQGVGFPDPGALRIPLVSKFPLSSASARSSPGPGSAARDTGGSGRGAGRRGEGRKAERAPDPLPASLAPRAPRPPPAAPGRGLQPRRPAGPKHTGAGRRGPGTVKSFLKKASFNFPLLNPEVLSLHFVNEATHLMGRSECRWEGEAEEGKGPRRTEPLISGTTGN